MKDICRCPNKVYKRIRAHLLLVFAIQGFCLPPNIIFIPTQYRIDKITAEWNSRILPMIAPARDPTTGKILGATFSFIPFMTRLLNALYKAAARTPGMVDKMNADIAAHGGVCHCRLTLDGLEVLKRTSALNVSIKFLCWGNLLKPEFVEWIFGSVLTKVWNFYFVINC